MPGIRVVTDSACDLPAETAADAGIVVVPLDVRLGDLSSSETAALSPAEFWRHCAEDSGLPRTAAPSPGAFATAFAAARDEGCDAAICVTISSKLSATYQSALTGAAELGSDFPVVVIDSALATMGEGLLALEAAEHAAAGVDVAELGAHLSATIPSIETFGTLDTLEYLRRGGRIGSAAALLGSLLSIKPVIEVRDGVVEPESRQRTRSRSLAYLAGKVRAAGPLKRLAVAHAAAKDLEEFLSQLSDVQPSEPLVVTYIGPVIGAHTGPGTIGVCLQRR